MRRILPIFAVLSLLCCLGVVGLWVRSYFRVDAYSHKGEVGFDYRKWDGYVKSRDGRLLSEWVNSAAYPTEGPLTRIKIENATPKRPPTTRYSLGFGPDTGTVASGLCQFTFESEVGPSWTVRNALGQTTLGGPAYWYFVQAPHWFFAAVVGFPGVWWVAAVRRRTRRRRRAARRLCVQCGYDVRATPEQCPECGAFVAGAT